MTTNRDDASPGGVSYPPQWHRKSVDHGGVPPHDGGMEARITKLEEHVGNLREDVAVVRERLSHMPTNADLLKVVSSAQWKIIAAIAVLGIGALLKWAWPILFH